MKLVYLAGPDVFFPDAARHFDRACARCDALGLRGVRPSDGGLSEGLGGTGEAIAERIFRANLELIRGCDALLANLMPFRNALEPDSGTVFEIGFAAALGKPVAGFLPRRDRSYEDKVFEHCGVRRDAHGLAWDDRHGFLVETFGQPMNLMLSRSAALFEGFDEALSHLAGRLRPISPDPKPAADGTSWR